MFWIGIEWSCLVRSAAAVCCGLLRSASIASSANIGGPMLKIVTTLRTARRFDRSNGPPSSSCLRSASNKIRGRRTRHSLRSAWTIRNDPRGAFRGRVRSATREERSARPRSDRVGLLPYERSRTGADWRNEIEMGLPEIEGLLLLHSFTFA